MLDDQEILICMIYTENNAKQSLRQNLEQVMLRSEHEHMLDAGNIAKQ